MPAALPDDKVSELEELFKEEDEEGKPLTIAAIAERTGLPPSTVGKLRKRWSRQREEEARMQDLGVKPDAADILERMLKSTPAVQDKRREWLMEQVRANPSILRDPSQLWQYLKDGLRLEDFFATSILRALAEVNNSGSSPPPAIVMTPWGPQQAPPQFFGAPQQHGAPPFGFVQGNPQAPGAPPFYTGIQGWGAPPYGVPPFGFPQQPPAPAIDTDALRRELRDELREQVQRMGEKIAQSIPQEAPSDVYFEESLEPIFGPDGVPLMDAKGGVQMRHIKKPVFRGSPQNSDSELLKILLPAMLKKEDKGTLGETLVLLKTLKEISGDAPKAPDMLDVLKQAKEAGLIAGQEKKDDFFDYMQKMKAIGFDPAARPEEGLSPEVVQTLAELAAAQKAAEARFEAEREARRIQSEADKQLRELQLEHDKQLFLLKGQESEARMQAALATATAQAGMPPDAQLTAMLIQKLDRVMDNNTDRRARATDIATKLLLQPQAPPGVPVPPSAQDLSDLSRHIANVDPAFEMQPHYPQAPMAQQPPPQFAQQVQQVPPAVQQAFPQIVPQPATIQVPVQGPSVEAIIAARAREAELAAEAAAKAAAQAAQAVSAQTSGAPPSDAAPATG